MAASRSARRRAPTPASAMPSSSTVAGSGTGARDNWKPLTRLSWPPGPGSRRRCSSTPRRCRGWRRWFATCRKAVLTVGVGVTLGPRVADDAAGGPGRGIGPELADGGDVGRPRVAVTPQRDLVAKTRLDAGTRQVDGDGSTVIAVDEVVVQLRRPYRRRRLHPARRPSQYCGPDMAPRHGKSRTFSPPPEPMRRSSLGRINALSRKSNECPRVSAGYQHALNPRFDACRPGSGLRVGRIAHFSAIFQGVRTVGTTAALPPRRYCSYRGLPVYQANKPAWGGARDGGKRAGVAIAGLRRGG